MRLGFVVLGDMCSVNDFEELTEVTLQDGNVQDLCLRLVDLDSKNECGEYQRYIPAAGANIIANFKSIDSNKNISRAMSQPYAADDRSILCVPLFPTDKLTFNGLTLSVTENGVTRPAYPGTLIVVRPAGDDRFFC